MLAGSAGPTHATPPPDVAASSFAATIEARRVEVAMTAERANRAAQLPGPRLPSVADRLAVVIAYAKAQVGKPYRRGAAGPGSYDCSGLLQRSWAQVGISLPHRSHAIGRRGRPVPRGQWNPADVLYWRSGHVALYVGAGKMIHAPGRGRRVSVASVYGSPQGRRLIG